ncbi:hypothetical protein LCGC14_0236130 [marine sediment metagenome]|uniref:Uncharacterized protein n=1 Tax=marine sediment metagenome TaxID=412755 RepID=A0A0F9UQL4_9ZZZZ
MRDKREKVLGEIVECLDCDPPGSGVMKLSKINGRSVGLGPCDKCDGRGTIYRRRWV